LDAHYAVHWHSSVYDTHYTCREGWGGWGWGGVYIYSAYLTGMGGYLHTPHAVRYTHVYTYDEAHQASGLQMHTSPHCAYRT
jgi:hypothetical protein